MSTDFRALCAELVDIVTAHCNPDNSAVGYCAAVLTRARAALAQPEPVAPTDEQWDALKERVWDAYQTIGYQGERFMYNSDFDTALDVVRHKLARWGTPTIQPVPVSERLPGPEDCDGDGRCWMFGYVEGDWRLISATNSGIPKLKYCFTHWLPANALPTPEAPNA
jgi:hypothetical protein